MRLSDIEHEVRLKISLYKHLGNHFQSIHITDSFDLTGYADFAFRSNARLIESLAAYVPVNFLARLMCGVNSRTGPGYHERGQLWFCYRRISAVLTEY